MPKSLLQSPRSTGHRPTGTTFVTVSAPTREQLQKQMETLAHQGFVQVGGIVSTNGVRGFATRTEFVGLMSR